MLCEPVGGRCAVRQRYAGRLRLVVCGACRVRLSHYCFCRHSAIHNRRCPRESGDNMSSIIKAGNAQARRAMVEGAWACRYPASVSRHLQLRLEKLPKPLQDSSWKAQVRLCTRYRRLIARGKHANHVVVAMARELAGFRWAVAKQVPVTPSRQQMERHWP
jgi:hypothetical protein